MMMWWWSGGGTETTAVRGEVIGSSGEAARCYDR